MRKQLGNICNLKLLIYAQLGRPYSDITKGPAWSMRKSTDIPNVLLKQKKNENIDYKLVQKCIK